jgi:ferritin
MLSKQIEEALNNQLKTEALSSHYYLAMASWAENKGYPGIAQFMYQHSDEERMHMLKLVKYINERGGVALIPALEQPTSPYDNITQMFESLLGHEVAVTQSINEVVHICLQEKDYSTHNFMQWYVAEQLEEEALAREIMDRLRLIGNDKGGMYMFDRDIQTFHAKAGAGDAGKQKM